MQPTPVEITAALTHLNNNFGRGTITLVLPYTFMRRIMAVTETRKYRVRGRDVYACRHCKRIPLRTPTVAETRAALQADPTTNARKLSYNPKQPPRRKRPTQPPTAPARERDVAHGPKPDSPW